MDCQVFKEWLLCQLLLACTSDAVQDGEKEEEKQGKPLITAVRASSHKVASTPDSKLQRELSPPKAEVPNNATHRELT